ncbi:MAG: hypothetical protein CM1200mP27_10190 [Chloroflexota bacterium]|nr:MAG: hypothetical protein CM1200mP27_10190 [Chloroflexota bacterium]
MYAPAIGQGAVDDYIRRTGIEALKGADILTTGPGMYQTESNTLALQWAATSATWPKCTMQISGLGHVYHGSI